MCISLGLLLFRLEINTSTNTGETALETYLNSELFPRYFKFRSLTLLTIYTEMDCGLPPALNHLKEQRDRRIQQEQNPKNSTSSSLSANNSPIPQSSQSVLKDNGGGVTHGGGNGSVASSPFLPFPIASLSHPSTASPIPHNNPILDSGPSHSRRNRNSKRGRRAEPQSGGSQASVGESASMSLQLQLSALDSKHSQASRFNHFTSRLSNIPKVFSAVAVTRKRKRATKDTVISDGKLTKDKFSPPPVDNAKHRRTSRRGGGRGKGNKSDMNHVEKKGQGQGGGSEKNSYRKIRSQRERNVGKQPRMSSRSSSLLHDSEGDEDEDDYFSAVFKKNKISSSSSSTQSGTSSSSSAARRDKSNPAKRDRHFQVVQDTPAREVRSVTSRALARLRDSAADTGPDLSSQPSLLTAGPIGPLGPGPGGHIPVSPVAGLRLRNRVILESPLVTSAARLQQRYSASPITRSRAAELNNHGHAPGARRVLSVQETPGKVILESPVVPSANKRVMSSHRRSPRLKGKRLEL